MDCLQDLAVNSIVILDNETSNSVEYDTFENDGNEMNSNVSGQSLLCLGDAVFKKSIKIHDKIHINDEIRICGDIIPLGRTSSIGTTNYQWLESNISYGNFNAINSKNTTSLTMKCNEMNVENINANKITVDNIHIKEINYDLLYINKITNSKIDICLGAKSLTLINLSQLKFKNKCDDEQNIYISLGSSEISKQKKIVIINPLQYDIYFCKNEIEFITLEKNNNTYQIYEMIYIAELNKWIIIYKY